LWINLPLSTVIALNLLEENKHVHVKVDALADQSQPHGMFSTNRSKATYVDRFQDQVQQVHGFFDKCHAGLTMWRTMFPLDPTPSALVALMAKFRNAAKVQTLGRSQLATLKLATFVHDGKKESKKVNPH
jgi:hypothetical protein